ncbi:endopeptidase La [Candidatus Gottesmanbacteria bacterium RIFCSPHIGHO2_02_FULL_40_24]|uniref:Lon protease n=1 Tax=Candidatus Gottesmanbacteria bacterium RIFCSPHIGHO2_01_FULL_40_15 TaxID=1798376 RepID=A0A1F5Z037_9BACT|nr:MAG: endopeptidase La [Candidatus Gottesmanbacteria bacterium RIFCSPHIGHO2_01_FULL_40_15]OGG18307.1 MAG: endopeptidase La [Candidatus Gottesmanbacteria bacterium RIFCSPHIGHO2_02_FULL_40_24]OGG22452.1 MAG: endopeptidase La [Candidatus Gottesmanbacteria bacterium RIFCSPLOWO2_01_FULL_40_10]OGG24864.1 MAG: endopeptidase La [Candidatus Gottesmanbacteria bacterium RIFCSPHIGHO2_12_FULL_40_13]
MTDPENQGKIKTLPVIPIRDGVVFPNTEIVLTFGRPRSLAAIEASNSTDRNVILVMQKTPHLHEPATSDLYGVGTIARIERLLKTDGEINALVKGIHRVEILSYESTDPYFTAKVVESKDEGVQSEETTALVNHITSELKRAVNLGKSVDFLSFMNIMSGLSPGEFANHVASVLDIKPTEKQLLLETRHVKDRLTRISEYLTREVKILEIERKIASKTQEKFDKSVKEAVLRERLKTIEKELGEENESKEVRELLDKIKKAKMSADVEEKAKKELKKLAQMSSYNPEASYIRTYLDWLVELPWSIASSNEVDIKQAAKILDEDHFGLKKVKERILEYLSVMKLKKKIEDSISKEKGKDNKNIKTEKDKKDILPSEMMKRKTGNPTILCFVGPPGVGKTSLGRSIARSLGRKFVKMSLGGIRDEAEIRGHRRTYVGSMPGRIIQGIKSAGTKNPVFMLDEIDKVGTDFRGDPSAALLEALDPEQNHSFSDHYMEVNFDLSDVMFITTCNILDTIPPALKDRLEIIHFPGYTEDEKFNIAKNFLVGKQIDAHGLSSGQITITDGVIHQVIRRYTREAGVRNLEREIATIFRKVAREVVEGKVKKITIKVAELQKYLGPAKFTAYLAEKKDEVGMSTGLAWTEAGGDILFIEVALMKGKGNLLLTGHLGDVMQESCKAAMSYVRAKAKLLGLNEKFYQNIDVHVHVPEGAVPKDGPSAGVAITTALVSALSDIPVKKTVAMTGEITLRGRALEIGGVKEKVIAAHRAGIKTVIMPKPNKKDLEDIPKYVLDDLKFVFVDHMDQVLKVALIKPLKTKEEELERPKTGYHPLIARLPS